jgi:PrtD family type I secretion system ABC transporter
MIRLDRPSLKALEASTLWMTLVATTVMNLMLLVMPLYAMQVYDRVLTSRNMDTLVFLSLIVVLVMAASALLDVFRARLLLRLGNKYLLDMGQRVFEASVSASVQLSVPLVQPMRQMKTIRDFVASPSGLCVLFDAATMPLFLAAVYLMHSGLGHAMLGGLLLLVLLAWWTEKATGAFVKSSNSSGQAAQLRLEGALRNAPTVVAMGMRTSMFNHWQSANQELLASTSQASDCAGLVAGMTKWVRWCISVLMTALGAWYVVQDQMTMGVMIAANLLSARGLAPLESLISAWKGFVSARIAAQRVDDLLMRFGEPAPAYGLPVRMGFLHADNLVYVPPGADMPSIKGVSFKVPAGQFVGLIGPSASGKSTLARLLCGVLRPRSGAVRWDGADVSGWGQSDHGQLCGYLPQSAELFAGTVGENIARFHADSDEQVLAASKLAGTHEMILRLPKGYDTRIGSGGMALSPGQTQLVALARALYGTPQLLVLDDPTANLDAQGEDALMKALQSCRKMGTTVIFISHRRAMLDMADVLCLLVEGQLQISGSQTEVLNALKQKNMNALAEHRRAGL